MTVSVHENFYRRTSYLSVQIQLDQPLKVAAHDPERMWMSVVCSQIGVDTWLSTNPASIVTGSDVCVFKSAQGVIYFETYGTNELFLMGLPIGTQLGITTMRRDPKAIYPNPSGRYVNRERILTVTQGGALPVASGGFQAFLAADNNRMRATIKTDGALALIANGTDPNNFMPISPFFPGYGVVETGEAIAFSTLAGSINHAWAIIDTRVAIPV